MATSSSPPEQQSLPLGFVRGEPVIDKPEDLYIPPDALELILESFSGPMDLLLYLIRRQKLDIVDLPILPITKQYMEYVEMMKEMKLELAADYLVMAAMLAEIKSRMLLPKPPQEDDDEVDPRAELVRRLQEYEAIRAGASHLDEMPQAERDLVVVHADTDAKSLVQHQLPEIALAELAVAFSQAMAQAELQHHHQVQRERLSTRERMSRILDLLQTTQRLRFAELFEPAEGKQGVVVSFLAILELVKEALVDVVQVDAFSEIHITNREQVYAESTD
ncbi:Segregation and condensation protein A [Pseudidiomarina piscicola]|uniref:Segregation and condensation protein A n=1 Tax=Pseudidiomarina piscicola TaxID=2614830 RepID=A0A6S6WKF9_9GAMM|nr:segregation/condensation protein A [Pseudidiomarina piscicola]CAB0150396.1 Segregation and condensation protein A [Pseudidiomarina piscicola]VZT39825.1 Segregation and condensation protein A [Pseudomonas aeruginosa]